MINNGNKVRISNTNTNESSWLTIYDEYYYRLILFYQHEQNEIKNILLETCLYAYTYVCDLLSREGSSFDRAPQVFR